MVLGNSRHINQIHTYQTTLAATPPPSKTKTKKSVKTATLSAFKPDTGTTLNTVAIILFISIAMSLAQTAHADDKQTNVLKAQIKELNQQLDVTRAEKNTAEQKLAKIEDPTSSDIKLGPVTIGGAMRVNYVHGDYVKSGEQPQRGGNGGNFELDTFRINASLDYEQVIGKFEYR